MNNVFQGLGIHVWPGDYANLDSLFSDIPVNSIRSSFGAGWDTLPNAAPGNATIEQMDIYVKDNFSGYFPSRIVNALKLRDLILKYSLKLILILWQSPSNAWLEGGKRGGLLLSAHVGDFCRFLGSLIQFLQSQNINPASVEMCNEPDGAWNMRLTPELYQDLVHRMVAEYAERKMEPVPIVGPGLSHIVQKNPTKCLDFWNKLCPPCCPLEIDEGKKWIDEFSNETLINLGEVSMHLWDNKWGAKNIRRDVKDFVNLVHNRISNKPIIFTEYGYGMDGQKKDTLEYALGIAENSLISADEGVNTLILWEDQDHKDWDEEGWGILDMNGKKKPSYFAFKLLALHMEPEHIVLPHKQVVPGLTVLWMQDPSDEMGHFAPTGGLVLCAVNQGTSAIDIPLNAHRLLYEHSSYAGGEDLTREYFKNHLVEEVTCAPLSVNVFKFIS